MCFIILVVVPMTEKGKESRSTRRPENSKTTKQSGMHSS